MNEWMNEWMRNSAFVVASGVCCGVKVSSSWGQAFVDQNGLATNHSEEILWTPGGQVSK